MNVREKSLKTILQKQGLVNYLLLAEGQGTSLRPPPKNRYEQPAALRPPPKYLILIEDGVDELIKGLSPDSLKKTGSLLHYLVKQIKTRIKQEKANGFET